jgi:hypothetical protein
MINSDHRHTPRGEFSRNPKHRAIAADNDCQVNGRLGARARPTDDRFDVPGMLSATGWPKNCQAAFPKKYFNPVKGLLDSA